MQEVQGIDRRALDEARHSRDARFDGRFFIAVKTTGIYCRPICPAPRCNARNVRYYPTAAAAASAGFRPCLRCRPESAPGTPAWIGTSAVVRRALRLIHEGALNDSSVDELALRVGVGSRHLNRLFVRHVGASPVAVAQTRRLHFAKRLLDETTLPMTRIALAAGYGSLRRFNHTFIETYGKAPRDLRKLRKSGGPQLAGDEVVLRLSYRPPFDWAQLTTVLAERSTAGVERIDALGYARAVATADGIATIHVTPIANQNALMLRVRGAPPAALLNLSMTARRVFDLAADPAQIAATLRRDAKLAPSLRRRPGLRIPGAWDPFECAVREIAGRAATVRLVRQLGEPLQAGAEGLTHLFPTASKLATARFKDLGRERGEMLRKLARAVADGRFDFSGPLESLVESLTSIAGERIARSVVLHAMGEPDVLLLPALAARADAWRPWRSYGYLHLAAGKGG